ncbi:MAG: RNA polymerase sigma factor [Lachnospiraceae bacterium]|nr:RNA polymerase sigma factor [Lachnospiraceae bacterium]
MDMDFLLIQNMKHGDSQAGERFIKKYYSAIYQYCFLHIHNQHDAEDMTQETFTRFFASLHTFQNCGKTKNYLYCIAGNVIKNHYKKRKDVLMDEIPEIPDDPLEDIEIRLDVEQAIDHLPNELKEITILYFFQNVKQREIAELLNIKLSLVKYRIKQAKKILSESFTD